MLIPSDNFPLSLESQVKSDVGSCFEKQAAATRGAGVELRPPKHTTLHASRKTDGANTDPYTATTSLLCMTSYDLI